MLHIFVQCNADQQTSTLWPHFIRNTLLVLRCFKCSLIPFICFAFPVVVCRKASTSCATTNQVFADWRVTDVEPSTADVAPTAWGGTSTSIGTSGGTSSTPSKGAASRGASTTWTGVATSGGGCGAASSRGCAGGEVEFDHLSEQGQFSPSLKRTGRSSHWRV